MCDKKDFLFIYYYDLKLFSSKFNWDEIFGFNKCAFIDVPGGKVVITQSFQPNRSVVVKSLCESGIY